MFSQSTDPSDNMKLFWTENYMKKVLKPLENPWKRPWNRAPRLESLETGDFNRIFFHPLENSIKITGFKDFPSVVPGFKAGFKDFQAVSRLSWCLGPIRVNSYDMLPSWVPISQGFFPWDQVMLIRRAWLAGKQEGWQTGKQDSETISVRVAK